MSNSNESHLDYMITNMGLAVVERVPITIVSQQKHPTGVITSLLDQLEAIAQDCAISVNADSLSTSNVCVLQALAKKRGYKLHVIKQGDKRLLWKE